MINVYSFGAKDKTKTGLVSIVLFIFLFGLFFSLPVQARGSSPVQITIEGQKVDFDVQPYIDKQNRTIVPLRFISEKLGYSVGWNSDGREVTILGENKIIKLWAGKKEALVNSQEVSLDTYTTVIRGRAMVPLRFVMENLGVVVDFNPNTKVVNLVKEPTNKNSHRSETDVGLVKVSNSVANLHSGPGQNYTIIEHAKKGEKFLVTGATNSWYQVAIAGGKEAWVMKKEVTPVDLRNPSEPNPPKPVPAPVQPKDPQPLKGKVIVIDPGHAKIQPGGWPDPGAVGPTGLQEKDVVLAIGRKVVEKLMAKGANVFITRTGNTTLTLAGRAQIANSNNADMFVSIHMNSNLNPSYNGTAVYYYNGNKAAQNKELASVLQNHLVQSLGLRDIGIIAESFAVLRYTQVPAVLVETAFISNPEEEKLAYTDSFREKAAQGIVAGIEAYLTK